jgi:hypothetical protein
MTKFLPGISMIQWRCGSSIKDTVAKLVGDHIAPLAATVVKATPKPTDRQKLSLPRSAGPVPRQASQGWSVRLVTSRTCARMSNPHTWGLTRSKSTYRCRCGTSRQCDVGQQRCCHSAQSQLETSPSAFQCGLRTSMQWKVPLHYLPHGLFYDGLPVTRSSFSCALLGYPGVGHSS